MKFAPAYPIYPHKINQAWGTYDPDDYHQFGFDYHNGEDDAPGIDEIVRAPFNGTLYSRGNQPKGGGIYCGFLSDDVFDFPECTCTTLAGVAFYFKAGKYRVLMDFLHLESISAIEGASYKTGDVLAKQDNTGFSTGEHTHIQPRRVTFDGKTVTFVDVNDANGSFSLTYFWSGQYAKDVPAITAAVSNAATVIQEIEAAPVPEVQKQGWFSQILAALLKAIQNK